MATGQSFDATVAAARSILENEDGGLESSISFMRRSGFSPIDCIRAVMILCRKSLAEAKKIVHYSDAWADIRASQEKLQNDLANEMERE